MEVKSTDGWGHRPAGREGGNGYGPICMITAQAMAAWSLIAECGLDIDQKRYMAAHEFLVKGTSNIGYGLVQRQQRRQQQVRRYGEVRQFGRSTCCEFAGRKRVSELCIQSCQVYCYQLQDLS